jgi:putative N6-adenine-specific DNA methylase
VTSPNATRGARKLQAAIDAFGLAARIAGASAIDVGASTGGFTATLLAHGARHVSAIDVGRGQLAAQLRADPRVAAYEQTDFRRAPLALAPGPFDFFTVDVSFMAARNVLRALAFRLAPGAHGIVLLKPQFELPSSAVRGGDVSDPRLRRRAYARFEARARALGFSVLAQRESDVAGGSGTIEMPLHVVFEQRPASLPKPGERRPARPANAGAARAASSGERTKTWFAVAAPGLSALLAREIAAIAGVHDAREQPGGVEFRGELSAGRTVNVHSRVATRVLLRLGEVQAREFGELRRRLGRLDFAAVLAPDRPLRIDATARGCRLYHTAALAQTLQLAASDVVGARLELARKDEADTEGGDPALPFGQESFQRLLLRGDRDRFTVSADSSGLLLHRRGARVETGRAPLRETLAAAALLLAGYDGEQPLVNAMCGAGTIALEAVDIALGRAPGRARHFALETFPCTRNQPPAPIDAAAASAERPAPRAPIHAFDSSAAAIEIARRNAERAGAAQHLQLDCADLLDYTPREPAGLLVANPPYGKRLGRARDVHELYREIGDRLRAAWRGYRVALLVRRDVRAEVFGLAPVRSFPLDNGGIAIKLLVGEVGRAAGARKRSRRRRE